MPIGSWMPGAKELTWHALHRCHLLIPGLLKEIPTHCVAGSLSVLEAQAVIRMSLLP